MISPTAVESLGDNCEFGFLQRFCGGEPGGLLRWAITNPEALVANLQARFADLYCFENLTPSSRDMILDSGSGLRFHTRMLSTAGVFDKDEDERREIHAEEIKKVEYLREKLLDRLDNPEQHFVYKTNALLSEAQIRTLTRVFEKNARSRLLIVQPLGRQRGRVKRLSLRVYFATISKLAPYDRADDIQYREWLNILAEWGETMMPSAPILRKNKIDAVIANYRDEAEFNYSVHISEVGRYVYFNTPKSACSAIKANLNLHEARSLGVNLTHESIADIHDRKKNLLKMPHEFGYQRLLEVLEDSEWTTFSFVREPVGRLVSAYLSKLTWNTGHKAALMKVAGRKEDEVLSIHDFISLVHDDPQARVLDEHWRPQRIQSSRNVVQHDYIGNFAYLERDVRRILKTVYPDDPSFLDIREKFRGNATNSSEVMKTLTKEDICKVLSAYAEDVMDSA